MSNYIFGTLLIIFWLGTTQATTSGLAASGAAISRSK